MTRLILRQLHLWTGLALCIPLVILGLTGSMLVFEDELRAAAPDRAAAEGVARPVADIVAAARAFAPAGFVPVSYAAPAASGGMASVRLSPPQRDAAGFDVVRVKVDPVTLRAVVDRQDGFLRQLFLLHSTLLLKSRDGRQLVGWLGVAMLVMGITGLVNWWPRRARWRAAFIVTRRAGGFRLCRELHGAAGIWGLAVLVTVSFAGVYLAFPETVRNIVDFVLPARDLRASAAALRVAPIAGAQPIDVDGAIAAARSGFPDSEPGLVFLPTRPDRPFRIALLRAGQDRKAPAITVFVDPWTRRVVEIFDPRRISLGERTLAWQHALHSGQGFGPVWKILVFLSGLLPLLFAVSGVTMWWLTRRRRESPTTTANPAFDQVDTAGRAAE